MVQTTKKKENSYKTPIAETVQATGNFLNSVQNPIFILALILLIGGGFVIFSAVHLVADSLDRISNKVDVLNNLLNSQANQNADELKMLEMLMSDRRECQKNN